MKQARQGGCSGTKAEMRSKGIETSASHVRARHGGEHLRVGVKIDPAAEDDVILQTSDRLVPVPGLGRGALAGPPYHHPVDHLEEGEEEDEG